MVKKSLILFLLIIVICIRSESQEVAQDSISIKMQQAPDYIELKSGAKLYGTIIEVIKTITRDVLSDKIIGETVRTLRIRQALTNNEFNIDWYHIYKIKTDKILDTVQTRGEPTDTWLSSIHFRLKFGYQTTVGNFQENLGSNLSTDLIESTYQAEAYKGSYGVGSKLNVAINYMFTNNVGIELGIYMPQSIKQTNNSTDYSPSMFFSPNLLLELAPERFFSLYAKFGPIITRPKFTSERIIHYYANSEYFTATIVETPKWAMGYSTTLGTSLHLFDQTFIYAEAQFSNLIFRPESGELRELLYRGESFMNRLISNSKMLNYSDNVQYGDIGTVNQPSYPFSIFDIVIGLEYAF